jgi:hypothetical protein
MDFCRILDKNLAQGAKMVFNNDPPPQMVMKGMEFKFLMGTNCMEQNP